MNEFFKEFDFINQINLAPVSLNPSAAERRRLTHISIKIYLNFNFSLQIYAGYVDDARNTDNAWLENTVEHFHEDSIVFEKYLLSVSFLSTLLINEMKRTTVNQK